MKIQVTYESRGKTYGNDEDAECYTATIQNSGEYIYLHMEFSDPVDARRTGYTSNDSRVTSGFVRMSIEHAKVIARAMLDVASDQDARSITMKFRST